MLARIKPGVVSTSFWFDFTFFTCMPAALTPTTLPLLTSAKTSVLPIAWILCLPFCLIFSPSRAFPLRCFFSLASVTPEAPMVLADAIIPSAVRRLIIGLLSFIPRDFRALDCQREARIVLVRRYSGDHPHHYGSYVAIASRRGLLQVAPDYMKPVRYDARKLQGLLRPQQMTSYDDNFRPRAGYLLVTHARHGQFRNFAAQFNRYPIS